MSIVDRLPKHILVGIGIFFTLCAISIFMQQGMVNSPDEAANKLFISTWSEQSRMVHTLRALPKTTYPLFPRSTYEFSPGTVAPSGFIGLPLVYGTIAKLFGSSIIFYLTLCFTIIASVMWWSIMCRIFDKKIADCSFWFFLFHPAVLYYTVRGLFPNMFFLDCAIIAIYFALHAYEAGIKEKWIRMVGAGCASGIAAVCCILVRPPEAFVIFVTTVLSLAFFGDRMVRRVCGSIFFVFLYGALMLWLVHSMHIIPGGYSFVNQQSIGELFFPFGIHVARVWHTAVQFIVKLFSPWVVFSTAGAALWLWRVYKEKKFDKNSATYFSIIFPVSIWLFVVYGSWQFSDNPADAQAVTLGSSYVRYWLPHLLFRMPFAAYLLYQCARNRAHLHRYIFLVCVLFSVIFGVWHAYFGVDGLLMVTRQVREARVQVREARELAPAGAVFAVRAWDKYFFPDAVVLQPFPYDIRTYGAVRELLRTQIPVWAFIETLHETDSLWLRKNGIAVRAVREFVPHTLYELSVWNEVR